jgi:hypothetical protein
MESQRQLQSKFQQDMSGFMKLTLSAKVRECMLSNVLRFVEG